MTTQSHTNGRTNRKLATPSSILIVEYAEAFTASGEVCNTAELTKEFGLTEFALSVDPLAIYIVTYSMLEGRAWAGSLDVVLTSDRFELSGKQFIEGVYFDLRQMKVLGNPAYVEQMDASGQSACVKDRFGEWHPYDPEKDRCLYLADTAQVAESDLDQSEAA